MQFVILKFYYFNIFLKFTSNCSAIDAVTFIISLSRIVVRMDLRMVRERREREQLRRIFIFYFLNILFVNMYVCQLTFRTKSVTLLLFAPFTVSLHVFVKTELCMFQASTMASTALCLYFCRCRTIHHAHSYMNDDHMLV